MRIRPATSADVPVLMALESHAITAAHWSAQQYEGIFLAGEPQRTAVVIEEDAGVQGFLVARAVESEWEIENVVVASSARRRGVGSQLLAEFLNTARSRGAEAVFLEVRESNAAARRLYEKSGFTQNGRRKRYYREPEEAAVAYRLQLSPAAPESVQPLTSL